jgi:hypothetical protein
MGYKPKRDEWVGKTVKLRFRDQKWMGIKSSWVVFERGKKGKEWEFVLVSIIGPDGVDECSKWKLCPYQADVDREAREQEQLARLAQSGQKSATDVAPMPAAPETPDVSAPTTAVAATPDAAAPPAEQPALTPGMAPADSGGPVEGVEPGAEPAAEPPTGQEAPVVVAGTEPPTTG